MKKNNPYIRWFESLTTSDAPLVGGKNASLGEMVSSLKKEDIQVPDGFATTTDAFRLFARENKIDKNILAEIERLKKGSKSLPRAGKLLRALF